ncbi:MULTISPECIES: hypothetical protein [Burkholderiaceae]|uniref:hypothetical protein n=1 Tax=Burkholderiaceae TaxID=119060 RepID=UPI00141FAA1A|nr:MULTISPECIES: hypothetical protein [Burkholderiaceae]MBN3850242.1 hypothetical protein [Paraburkholderia sp. Ac-20342]NIF55160.1 hypothetical protein [Burkholderia sp. Ax-1724]
MTQQTVKFGIQLPVDMGQDVAEVARELSENCQVSYRLPEPDSESAKDELSFDPISGAAIGWILLKVVGAAAQGIAAKLIIELVCKRYMGRSKESKVVPIRFSDGTIFELNTDDPESTEQLRKILAEKADR